MYDLKMFEAVLFKLLEILAARSQYLKAEAVSRLGLGLQVYAYVHDLHVYTEARM